MMRPPALAMLVLLTLVAPGAQAGWLDRDVTITVAPERVGDRLSYEIAHAAPELDAKNAERDMATSNAGRGERVILIEGASRAIDPYGIERETVAYRTDITRGETVEWAARCHRLAGGLDVVRTDHLTAAAAPEGKGTFGAGRMEVSAIAQFADRSCAASAALAGRTLTEGDSLTLAQVDPALATQKSAELSATGEPAEFEGRAALRFTFDTGEGVLAYVLADGLPGFAERTLETATGDGARYVETMTLRGYASGEGVAIAAHTGATLPARNPDATFSTPEPLGFDDEAYALAFPYDDAYAAILADPTVGFADWLRAHPEAVLEYARYDADMRAALGLTSRGGWDLMFADASAGRMFTVVRADGASTPLGPLVSPQGADRVVSQSEYDVEEPAVLPAEVADSASLAKVASAHGIDAAALAELMYMPGRAFLQLTLESKGEAQHVVLDITTAGVSTSFETTRDDGPLLGSFRGGVAREERSMLAAIPAPPAIATGAAAGAGLLLLLFLVPLFTRLRRDRLLDNPVRARLYERIRAEPGIHRAELVDFAGIGEGATRHHLAQLVKHHLLVETAQDGFVRYFAAGEVPPSVARREALLRAGSHRAVYELYAQQPTISLRDAGARLGMSAPSVHRAKKKLEHAGLLPAVPDASQAVAEA